VKNIYSGLFQHTTINITRSPTWKAIHAKLQSWTAGT